MHILIIPTSPNEEAIVAEIFKATGLPPQDGGDMYYPLIKKLKEASEQWAHFSTQPLLIKLPE